MHTYWWATAPGRQLLLVSVQSPWTLTWQEDSFLPSSTLFPFRFHFSDHAMPTCMQERSEYRNLHWKNYKKKQFLHDSLKCQVYSADKYLGAAKPIESQTDKKANLRQTSSFLHHRLSFCCLLFSLAIRDSYTQLCTHSASHFSVQPAPSSSHPLPSSSAMLPHPTKKSCSDYSLTALRDNVWEQGKSRDFLSLALRLHHWI